MSEQTQDRVAVACCHRGCDRPVWVRRGGRFNVDTDSATCLGCRRVALCLEHFIGMGACPHCGANRWRVVLFEGRLPAALAAEIEENGGRIERRGGERPAAPTPRATPPAPKPWITYTVEGSPKGAYALGEWLAWPVAGGARIARGADERFVPEGGVTAVAGRGGALMLTRGERGLAFLDEGRLMPLTPPSGRHQRGPVALGEGRFLFLEISEGGADIWRTRLEGGRAQSRRLGRRAPDRKAHLCAFGPGAALLVGSDGVIERVDLESGERQRAFDLPRGARWLRGAPRAPVAAALDAEGEAWIIDEDGPRGLGPVERGALFFDEASLKVARYAEGALIVSTPSGAELERSEGPPPLGLRWA